MPRCPHSLAPLYPAPPPDAPASLLDEYRLFVPRDVVTCTRCGRVGTLPPWSRTRRVSWGTLPSWVEHHRERARRWAEKIAALAGMVQ